MPRGNAAKRRARGGAGRRPSAYPGKFIPLFLAAGLSRRARNARRFILRLADAPPVPPPSASISNGTHRIMTPSRPSRFGSPPLAGPPGPLGLSPPGGKSEVELAGGPQQGGTYCTPAFPVSRRAPDLLFRTRRTPPTRRKRGRQKARRPRRRRSASGGGAGVRCLGRACYFPVFRFMKEFPVRSVHYGTDGGAVKRGGL